MSEEILSNKIDNLSDAERDIAFSILEQYKDKGISKLYNDLLWADYNEIPVDIFTFVDDNRYLGNAWHDTDGNSKLYPYWREKLPEIIPNNTEVAINNAIFSGSRGRGKSEIAVLLASYLMYRVMCLKDPVAFFHLKPTEKICFAFMNIKLSLAEEIANDKFQKTVQMSPWFMERGTMVGRTEKFWTPPEYIEIIIGSQSSDVIGKPIYFCLDGDTIINTIDGEYKIKDLQNKTIQVQCLDDNNQITISEPCTVKPTAESDIEYEIELENGSIIKCTPSHRFMLKDGTYKEAQYLTEEDELYDL